MNINTQSLHSDHISRLYHRLNPTGQSLAHCVANHTELTHQKLLHILSIQERLHEDVSGNFLIRGKKRRGGKLNISAFAQK